MYQFFKEGCDKKMIFRRYELGFSFDYFRYRVEVARGVF